MFLDMDTISFFHSSELTLTISSKALAKDTKVSRFIIYNLTAIHFSAFVFIIRSVCVRACVRLCVRLCARALVRARVRLYVRLCVRACVRVLAYLMNVVVGIALDMRVHNSHHLTALAADFLLHLLRMREQLGKKKNK